MRRPRRGDRRAGAQHRRLVDIHLEAQEHITFNPSGQESSESDLNGYSTSLSYTGALLTQIKDAAMRTLTLTYTSGLLTKVNDDQTGRFVSYAYNDGNGNLTDVTDVNGGNSHYGYGATHLLTTFRDARGNTTTNHYNAQNQVDWQKDALTRLTQFCIHGVELVTGWRHHDDHGSQGQHGV